MTVSAEQITGLILCGGRGTRMGGAEITMQMVEEIERTKNGKIQAVVCRLTADERNAVLSGSRAQSPAAAAS